MKRVHDKPCNNSPTCRNRVAKGTSHCQSCIDLMKLLTEIHRDVDDRGVAGTGHCPEAFDSERRIELHRARSAELKRILNH